MRKMFLAAALAASTGVAQAATFNFSGSGANAASRVFTLGSLSVTATPGTHGNLSNQIFAPDGNDVVTQNAAGLGVDLGVGNPPEINGGFDLLTLTFSEKVSFTSIRFGEVDSDDDADIYIDGAILLEDVKFGGVAGNPYLFAAGITGTSISIGADTLFGFLGAGDDFRVLGITVAPVPVPAALPLLAAALGGLGLLARRRAA